MSYLIRDPKLDLLQIPTRNIETQGNAAWPCRHQYKKKNKNKDRHESRCSSIGEYN